MFSADWLTLREPADVAARSEALTRAVADALDPRLPLRAVDLAAGTGANARYLADHVHRAQEWLLVDHDPVLLSHVAQRMSLWAFARGGEIACAFDTRQADLRTLDDPAIFSGRALVAASALLDLVSGSWLRALAARCREADAAALFALTYDGRMSCSPAEPEDERIRALVNAHQRTDKGFGPALGPDAVDAAAAYFADVGYQIRREPSDWVLGSGSHRTAAPADRRLGGGGDRARAGRSHDQSSAGERAVSNTSMRDRSQLIVGHEDLAAWPHGGDCTVLRSWYPTCSPERPNPPNHLDAYPDHSSSAREEY